MNDDDGLTPQEKQAWVDLVIEFTKRKAFYAVNWPGYLAALKLANEAYEAAETPQEASAEYQRIMSGWFAENEATKPRFNNQAVAGITHQ